MALCLTAVGQDAREAPPAGETTETTVSDRAAALSVDRVTAKIGELENSADIDAAFKTKLLESYRSALTFLETAQGNRAAGESFKNAVDQAPVDAERARTRLQQLQKAEPAAALPAETSAAELDTKLASERADLAALNSALAELNKRFADSQARPEVRRQQAADVERRLAEIDAAGKAGAPDGEGPREAEARRILLEARRTAAQSELAMLEQERISYPARLDRLTAERDLKNREVTLAEAKVKALDDQMRQRQVQAAERSRMEAERARRDAIGKHPVVSRLAEENAALSDEYVGLTRRNNETVASAIIRTREQAKQVGVAFERAQSQIKVAGLSEGLAQILLDQRRRLEDVPRYRRSLANRKAEIAEAGLRRIKIEEQLRGLEDLDGAIRRLMADDVDTSLSVDQRGQIEEEIRKLLETQVEILEQLNDESGKLLLNLGELETERTRYIDAVQEYAAFLDERLLWIPSSAPLNLGSLKRFATSAGWFLNPTHWVDFTKSLGAIPVQYPGRSALVLLVAAFLLLSKRRINGKMDFYASAIKRISTDQYRHTLKAAGLTALKVVPVPFVLGFAGWQLSEMDGVTEFSRAAGNALVNLSATLFGIRLFVKISGPRGLGEAHFRWKPETTAKIRKHLHWLLPFAMVTISITSLTESQTTDLYRHSLGRISFIVGVVALACFVSSIMHPRFGVFSSVMDENPNGWLSRLKTVWYPMAVGVPAILAVLAGTGYYYTALQLELRLVASAWLLVGSIVFYYLIVRWFLMKERKLALEQAMERRRAASEARKQDASQSQGELETIPEVQESEIDLAGINEQSRRLLRSLLTFSLLIGFWLIWESVLPAMNALNSIEVWSQSVVKDGQSVSQPVTLAHLALGLIIGIVTTIAAKNIPGVLEIAILQNLPITPGSRYAIVAVCQYFLLSVGVIVAFNVIGVNWSQFGWIVAALSVGLGFGLQEVVANFVCGVILLAERPIRVGDIVTVSDVTGVISKIRIRATTITNWERQEFIVPNKEFITGRILNWTLSNTINRIVVTVGLAYGSDVERARELLLQIAREHPETMDDPAPLASFEGFDESTLRILLRCYLPTMEKRLQTISELHSRIHKRFAEAGIEIAFPQRDIHVIHTNLTPMPGAEKGPRAD